MEIRKMWTQASSESTPSGAQANLDLPTIISLAKKYLNSFCQHNPHMVYGE